MRWCLFTGPGGLGRGHLWEAVLLLTTTEFSGKIVNLVLYLRCFWDSEEIQNGLFERWIWRPVLFSFRDLPCMWVILRSNVGTSVKSKHASSSMFGFAKPCRNHPNSGTSCLDHLKDGAVPPWVCLYLTDTDPLSFIALWFLAMVKQTPSEWEHRSDPVTSRAVVLKTCTCHSFVEFCVIDNGDMLLGAKISWIWKTGCLYVATTFIGLDSKLV